MHSKKFGEAGVRLNGVVGIAVQSEDRHQEALESLVKRPTTTKFMCNVEVTALNFCTTRF